MAPPYSLLQLSWLSWGPGNFTAGDILLAKKHDILVKRGEAERKTPRTKKQHNLTLSELDNINTLSVVLFADLCYELAGAYLVISRRTYLEEIPAVLARMEEGRN